MIAQKYRVLGAMGAAALMLSGCSFSSGLTKQEKAIVSDLAPSQYQPASRETRNNIETQDNFAQAAFWSREYQLNPADLEAAIKLSAAVRKMGNPAKAVEIAQTSRAMYPRDPYLLAEYAAALIASDRGSEANEALDSGLRMAPGYARLWSLKGAALDQQENYDLARKHYSRALQITPNDPNIMSNLGLNYALAGDPKTAETWMRRAAMQPGAGPNIKQNLDLVLQLQGKSASLQSPSGQSPSAPSSSARSSYPSSAQNSAPALRPAPNSRTPRTYGEAVQAFESRPQQMRGRVPARSAARAPQRQAQARPQASSQAKYSHPQSASSGYGSPQASADFSHRSNVTIVGQQGQAKSASDMARAAAAKSRGRSQKITVPAGTHPQAASQAAPADILSRLSNNVGPRRTQQSAQLQTQRPAPRQMQPQYSNGYPGPNYGYPPQPAPQQMYGQPTRRGSACRR